VPTLFFSRGIKARPRSQSKVFKREKGVWQRRYWEHAVRDDVDLERHVNGGHASLCPPYSFFNRGWPGTSLAITPQRQAPRAPKNDFREAFQADLGCPVLARKNFRFRRRANHI
jgi:hypothetical protein